MNHLFTWAAVGVLALMGLCGYWYLYPQHAPRFLRENAPILEFRSLQSPVSSFRPPQY